MKKRTKISLRTKIYLTIVALLALTGVFYAQCPHGPSTPGAFVGGIPFPTGVAAAPDLLLVSEYCSQNIDKVDCNGVVSLFATLPVLPNGCQEKYIAIAPSQPPGPPNNMFTPRDVFVTEGNQVFQIGGIFTPFAVLNGCGSGNHTGITFDHTATGIFGNDMIVTCQGGNVYRIHGNNNGAAVAPIANVFASGPLTVGEIEGPAVVPLSFGPRGGEIWVADELNNRIHTIGPPPTYTVTQSILVHDSAEGVYVIPNPPCTFTPMGCLPGNGNGAFFLAEQQLLQLVWQYPLSDFTIPPIGGNVILTSESGGTGADTSLVTVSGNTYVQCSFGPRIAGNNEGASFVDCDVPIASPTPTPTSTSTPTPTPTPTPSGTPSGCPTSITSNFNGTPIKAGNYIWFTSVLKAHGLPANQVVTIHFTNQSITSSAFTLSPGDATVIFDPSATMATTTFVGGMPTTTVPSGINGNTFFSALSYLVPANIPGGLNPVTWSGTISSDTPGVTINWQWAAAVYTSFDSDYTLLGVKPVDDKTASQYQNSDHAGTPENFKQFVIGGARGGGGANYTGSYSGTGKCP